MYNLLIAEDEEEVRSGIKGWLESQMDCYRVLTAKNGAKALEILQRENVDCIFLDMLMPVMDGLSLLKELKKAEYTSAMMVVISGFDEFKYAQAAMECGAVKYVLKPVTPDAILEVATEIKGLLDKKANTDSEIKFLRENMQKKSNIDIQGRIPRLSFDVAAFTMDLRMGLKEEVKNKISDFFSSCPFADARGKDMLYTFLSLVSAALASAANESGICLSEILSDYPHSLEEIYKLESHTEIKKKVLNIVEKVMSYLAREKSNKSIGIVEHAKKIIDKEYAKNISCAYLSKRLFLNKDYLGRLFKSSTGLTINDYLNRVRIERAKSLLKKDVYKVYEVALGVGYTDEHYFSTIFKKLTGKTPTEYKDV